MYPGAVLACLAVRVADKAGDRHLPVVGDDGSPKGMVDILDICEALLGPSAG
jgi:hypothetical protein